MQKKEKKMKGSKGSSIAGKVEKKTNQVKDVYCSL